jgi:hypothetical protein
MGVQMKMDQAKDAFSVKMNRVLFARAYVRLLSQYRVQHRLQARCEVSLACPTDIERIRYTEKNEKKKLQGNQKKKGTEDMPPPSNNVKCAQEGRRYLLSRFDEATNSRQRLWTEFWRPFLVLDGGCVLCWG